MHIKMSDFSIDLLEICSLHIAMTDQLQNVFLFPSPQSLRRPRRSLLSPPKRNRLHRLPLQRRRRQSPRRTGRKATSPRRRRQKKRRIRKSEFHQRARVNAAIFHFDSTFYLFILSLPLLDNSRLLLSSMRRCICKALASWRAAHAKYFTHSTRCGRLSAEHHAQPRLLPVGNFVFLNFHFTVT